MRIHDETVIVVHPAGNAQQLLRSARAALPDHDPVLVLDGETVLEPDFHHSSKPRDLITWAQTAAELARFPRFSIWGHDPAQFGTGDEGYDLGHSDVTGFGEPEVLVILPRPEPWAAFAYLDPYYGRLGTPEGLLLAAARRWHEWHGAAPTTIGIFDSAGAVHAWAPPSWQCSGS